LKKPLHIFRNINPGFTIIARVSGLYILLLFCNTQLYAQEYKTLKLIERIELDGKLFEISGITYSGNMVFAINDSGNSREVHILDPGSFKVLSSIKVKDSNNVDWEEISYYNDTLYIGDFGNNFGNRSDLGIYKIPIDYFTGSNSGAEKIKFEYIEQARLKMTKYKKHIFDCEAMIVDRDGIWLFSKDWVDRTSRLYTLSTDIGPEKGIRPMETLNLDYLVTGAYRDTKNRRMVLCGYENENTYVTIFSGIETVSFSGQHTTYIVPEIEFGQVESVFVKDNVAYLASERTGTKQSIYKVKLPNIKK
jgi:hypothetical protein